MTTIVGIRKDNLVVIAGDGQASFGNTFSPTLAPFLSRLSLLGVTFGGLEMQLSGPKTDFGAQGVP